MLHTLNTTQTLIINLVECTDFDSNLTTCRILRYAMNLRVPQRESKVHASLNLLSSRLLHSTHKHTRVKRNVIEPRKSAAFKKTDTCKAASDLHGSALVSLLH